MFNDFIGADVADQILKALASSAGAGTSAAPMIKEDLELEAANTLYDGTEEYQFSLAKDMPFVPATSVIHEFTRVNSYGASGDELFYPENGLPEESALDTERKTVPVKLIGSINAVFALAAAQKSINVLGQADLVSSQAKATMLRVWDRMNQALYGSDSRTTAHSNRWPGVIEQIETFFDNGGAPLADQGDHILDLHGAGLAADDIRKGCETVVKQYGHLSGIYMPPEVQTKFEASLDPAERLAIPRRADERVLLGQNVGGMLTQGGQTIFRVDNSLSPIRYQKQAPTKASANAPAAPAGGDIAVVGNVGPVAGSKWVAADAGADITYSVTALNAKGESLEAVKPAVAVAATGSATITIQSASPNVVTSYKVYRNKAGQTGRFCIKEIKNVGGALVFEDKAEVLPNTATVLGLDIRSSNFARIAGKPFEMRNNEKPGNTVVFACLMPMAVFPLAAVLQTVANDLHFIAGVPEVRIPRRAVIWKNCAIS